MKQKCNHNSVNLKEWTDVVYIRELYKQHPETMPIKCQAHNCNKLISINQNTLISLLSHCNK